MKLKASHKLAIGRIVGSNDTLYCKRSHLCDEFLDANASLFQYSRQCADLQFAVIRDDAHVATAAHDNVTTFCPMNSKPSLSRAFTAWAPETIGKLGMGRNIKRSYKCLGC